MERAIVNPNPKYAPPVFAQPPRSGFLYLAAAVAPPTGPPFVRRDAGRDALLRWLKSLASELARLPGVVQATVYRAVLVAPARPGATPRGRYDVAVLLETRSPDVIDEVRASTPFEQMLAAMKAAASDVLIMAARCIRSFGVVDRTRPGLFLFNHFTAGDSQVATALWERLAGWYAAETGLSNSTLLEPIGECDYVFVNHARWDKSVLRLAAEQFGKKTFRSYVRANLKANQVVAMPVLYRLA